MIDFYLVVTIIITVSSLVFMLIFLFDCDFNVERLSRDEMQGIRVLSVGLFFGWLWPLFVPALLIMGLVYLAKISLAAWRA